MTKKEKREKLRKEWAEKARSEKLDFIDDESDLVDNLYLKDESEQNA